MFDNFRRKRANKDILDVPDWVTYIYLFGSAGLSIAAVYLASDLLPAKLKPVNLLIALVFAFMGLGFFLQEWYTNSPLRRVVPTLLFFAAVSVVLLFLPIFWLGPLGVLAFLYQRFRLWRISKTPSSPNAP
jgi:hypothetical protein